MPWIPLLGIYAVFVAALFLAGVRALLPTLSVRQRFCWPVAFILVACFIFAVGVVAHFRVLGRHCTPVLPFVLFVIASGVVALWDRRLIGRLAVTGFFAFALTSCLMVRFGERHAKDDYRNAARFARAALDRGERVWWSADAEGGIIYGLPVSTNAQSEAALFVANQEPGFESALEAPSLVLTSKPDIYDGAGALSMFLKEHGYKPVTNFVAFTAWRFERDGR